MELFFIILILFAKKQHKAGFSHFDETGQKTVFFYNPWVDGQILVNGYATGISGSGFLNFPSQQRQISVQVINQGAEVFAQDYKLYDDFIMIFLPQDRRAHIKRVLP